MKIIFLTLINLVSFLSFSQVSLKKLDGTPINDNDIIVFSELTDPESYLGLKIFNSSNQNITVKIKVVSIENSNALNLQLCISPICVPEIAVGNSYPTDGSIIPANGRNGNFDHFINMNSGIVAGQNVNYVFKLYMVNSTNIEIGNSVTFTYRYTPALSTSDFSQLASIGINLKSTTAVNSLEFTSIDAVSSEIYDLTGKQVFFNKEMKVGNQSIDVSNLSSNIYLAQFTTLNGKKATIKFIKN